MIERARIITFEPQTLKLIYSAQVCADCCYGICMSQDENFGVMASEDATPGICESCSRG